MKKFLIHMFLFLCFALVGYSALVVVWGEVMPKGFKKNINYRVGSYGHMNTRMKEAKQLENVDVLFLGASDAYRSFDTRVFEANGYNVFNLGSSSQSPLQTEVLLKRYLPTLKPKKVIYAVSPFVLCSDGVESALDLEANEEIGLNTLKMVVRVNQIKPYNTFIYSAYRQLLRKDDNFEEPLETDEDKYIKGGFVEKKYFDFNSKMKVATTKNDLEFNNKQKRAFENILSMLQSIGAEIILVKTPVARYEQYTHPLWDSIQSYYTTKAPYYNFNQPNMGFVDTLHFNDQYHLNQRGVEKFNAMLIDSLFKN
jgi:hypothetical protein